MEQLEKINFSYNWNKKLLCDAYTTFRIYNEKKYQKGKKFHIYLKKQYHHTAEIIDIKKLRLNQVNEFIAHIDTGYTVQEFNEVVRRMYKKHNVDKLSFCLILLKQIQ